MNRHSPLFRVAFGCMALAIALPFLVFTAAHVRHRQLQSKANPRWAKFAEVNGPRKPEPPIVREAVQTTQPATDSALVVRPISQIAGGSNQAAEPDAISEFRDHVPAETPVIEPPAAPSADPHVGAGRRKSSDPSPPIQTAEAAPPQSKLVPEPDDEPEIRNQQRRTEVRPRRPAIVFHTQDNDLPPMDAPSHRLEARLAGLQRRIEQLAQAQVDQQMSDLDRAVMLLQQAQQAQQAQQSQQTQQGLQPNLNANPIPINPGTPLQTVPGPVRQLPPDPSDDSAPDTSTSSGGSKNSRGRDPTIKIIQGDTRDDDERFSIQVQDANIVEVLEMLGQMAGANILASRDVKGRVSLNLQDVTVDRALDALLKSQGYTYERDGDFIYVRTIAEDAAQKQASRKLVSKVYQLHYINANEVQKLLDPLLTKGVGRHAITSPSQVGIAQTPSAAGGDGLSQRDTIVVQDYPEVIVEVDKIIAEVDVPPLQVMIEAKILSVALSDSLQFGVNFAMLTGNNTSQLLTGDGTTLNSSVGFPKNPVLVPAAGDFVANTAGLTYGYIAGDVSLLIEALEEIADTTLVASPNLRVLNKQKAEMIIGERLSYVTLAFNGTQTVQNVNFLDAGTKLIFRPFISPDGIIRLEVHPERSSATINSTTGLPNLETTEVTTNVMVRDGTTVVIGGLITEEITENINSVPFLGSLPLVGAAFRNRNEQTLRTEMIVLITPHIVRDPEACLEGGKLQCETEERAAYFRDHLSPVNRTSLTRAHYEQAVVYFEQGNLLKARQQIDIALQKNKGDLECQRLKLKIEKATREQQAKAWKWPMMGSRTTTTTTQ